MAHLGANAHSAAQGRYGSFARSMIPATNAFGDLPALPLQPTPHARVIRVRQTGADGQALAGSGKLVWEGETVSRH